MSQCEAFGLLPSEAAQMVVKVIHVVDIWRTHFESVGVTPNDLDSLAEHIDGDRLLNQRRTFDPKLYQKPAPKRKPASPFRRT